MECSKWNVPNLDGEYILDLLEDKWTKYAAPYKLYPLRHVNYYIESYIKPYFWNHWLVTLNWLNPFKVNVL